MPLHGPQPFPACFDAYLRYAIQTEFAYFRRSAMPAKVVLLARLSPNVAIDEALRQLESLEAIEFGPVGFGDGRMRFKPRFLTLRGPLALLDPSLWALWDFLFCWITLSMPVASKPGLLAPRFIDPDRPKSRSRTVLAVIDDGCPFAREQLRVAPGGHASRVFAIWDQDSRKPAALGPRHFGREPIDFRYGIEFRRASSTVPADPEIGIDDWIGAHATPWGSIDEQACYAKAGFESLGRSRSHGAHVLDLFAGAMPPSSGFSYDPQRPPTFKRASDEASQSDVIFVQIPRAAVDDPTGGWLDAQVTDALFYIMSCIDPDQTDHVVVNLSYGPTTRPHDGNSNLEFVMSTFAGFFNGSGNRPKLDIVIAAGNSRLADWHVVHRSSAAKPQATWSWRVPPDNPVPVFAEIWVPKGKQAFVSGRLLAPSPAVPYSGQLPFIARAESPCSDSYGWLIVLPPTQGKPLATPPVPPPSAPDGEWAFASTPPPAPAPSPSSPEHLPPGPHGNWQIELKFAAPDLEAHAYIARSDPNMGARLAAKPTRFVDVEWERTLGAAAAYRLVDGVRDLTGSLVRRDGTLNGIGTSSSAGLHVVGGYRLHDGKVSRYSSIGPSRGPRPGPDCVFASDESLELLGLRAGGNRSATVFRLVGTSTASPQFARQIANKVPLLAGGGSSPAAGVGKQPSP